MPMKALGDLIKNFNPTSHKNVSREFQSFGVYLADKLGDSRRKALYIKYAKHIPRPILEEALRFVIDSNAKSKGALFMWKLKELQVFEKYPLPGRSKKKTGTKKAPKAASTTSTKTTEKVDVPARKRKPGKTAPGQQRLD